MAMTVCVAAALAAARPTAADTPAKALGAVLREARARQAAGAYEEAANGYEAYARASGPTAESLRALEDAIELRLALGQVDKAGKDADLLVARHRKAEPARAARASIAVSEYEVEHGNPAGGQSRLEAWMVAFGDGAPLDTRLHAQTLFGRAAVQLHDDGTAGAAYGRVLDLWKDPAAAQRALAAEGADARRVGAALSDVGEALFHAAERKRKEADKIRFPEYRGADDKDEVVRHVKTEVAEWARQKQFAIEVAEREYQKIVALQPAPPPKWVVRGANRVGTAWGKLVAEYRAAPIPAAWKGHGLVPGKSITYDELRAAYYRALDDASVPLKQRTKAAFQACVTASAKYQYADELSRACHEWLSKNYPNEPLPAAR
jgi:hypothetical protein